MTYGRRVSRHVLFSQLLLLSFTGCLVPWFWSECVDGSDRWLLGSTLVACVLGLWAHTLWAGNQIDRIPEGLSSGERKALLAPLLRRLWGAFVLALLLPFIVRSGAERFLPSRPRNEMAAERGLHSILYSQAAFVAQRKSQGQMLRAAAGFDELAPWILPELLDGENSGYRFHRMRTYDARGGSDPRFGFAYCAVPVRYGETGRRKYVFRHSGEWWYQDDGRGLPESDWIWADDISMVEGGWTRLSADSPFVNAGLPEAPK